MLLVVGSVAWRPRAWEAVLHFTGFERSTAHLPEPMRPLLHLLEWRRLLYTHYMRIAQNSIGNYLSPHFPF